MERARSIEISIAMPKAARKGEHDGFPASKAIEGSPDIDINGKTAVRVGDAFEAHPHERHLKEGWSSASFRKIVTAIASIALAFLAFLIFGQNIFAGLIFMIFGLIILTILYLLWRIAGGAPLD